MRFSSTTIAIAFPAIIVLLVIVLFSLSPVQGRSAGQEPILSYPPTLPTPTMGQPPAAAAAPALSSDAAPLVLSPSDLLAGWQVVDRPTALPSEGGRWVLRDELLAQDGMGPTAALSERETMLISPEPSTYVATLFYDVRNGTAALIVGYTDANTFYRLRVHTSSADDTPPERFVLERVHDGVVTILAIAASGAPISRFTWQTMSLQVQGDQITAYLGAERIVQLTDPTPLAAGRVGIATRAFGGILFSSVTLRSH